MTMYGLSFNDCQKSTNLNYHNRTSTKIIRVSCIGIFVFMTAI